MLAFLKINILVIQYVLRDIEISRDELERVLKEALSSEDVEEKYVRDFLNCGVLWGTIDMMPPDRLMFIHTFGSKKAKKIAVDEKLKIR